MLIHAGGGSKHSAPHVRHTHHFQQALNRAVLAIGTVQHRQYRVHMAKGGQRMVHFRVGHADEAGAEAGIGGIDVAGLADEETVLAARGVKHHRA